jgi:hypothetical protein
MTLFYNHIIKDCKIIIIIITITIIIIIILYRSVNNNHSQRLVGS